MSDRESRSTRKRPGALAIVVLVAVLIATVFFLVRSVFCSGYASREASRQEIREFAAALELGESTQTVLHTFRAGEFRFLSLYNDSAETQAPHVVVGTPVEFGALNWCLFLSFDHDRLVAIRVRTDDGAHREPEGSPPDRVVPGHEDAAFSYGHESIDRPALIHKLCLCIAT